MVEFISRHSASPAQRDTCRAAFDEDLSAASKAVVFNEGQDPALSLREAGVASRKVAIVAPNWVALSLLRQGYTLLEFVNQPSARARGTFLCKGAFVHTLGESSWVASPVPIEEQEEQAIG